MDATYFLRSSFLLLFFVPSSWLSNSSITITGNLVLGGNAFVTCRWSLDADIVLRQITILSPVGGQFSDYFGQNKIYGITYGVQYHNRIYFAWELSEKKAIMRVSKLQCSDQREYACLFEYRSKFTNVIHPQHDIKNTKLIIRVPPSSLKMNIETPGDIKSVNHVMVAIGDTVKAVCSGVVDKRKDTVIDWIIFRNCQVENIHRDDGRIKSLKIVTEPLSSTCTQQVQQNLTISVTGNMSLMMISCFFRYIDSVINKTQFCWKPDKDNCVRSEYITMLPSVEESAPALYSAQYGEDERSPLYIIITVGVISMVIGLVAGAALDTARNSKKRVKTKHQVKKIKLYK